MAKIIIPFAPICLSKRRRHNKRKKRVGKKFIGKKEDMIEDFVAGIASKLGEYLVAPNGRQFGYVLFYKSYVEDLKNEVKELETARQRVQHVVDEAWCNRKPIQTAVEDWLESVKKESKEAENLLKHGESEKSACFRGWLPNPVVRHPIGRKVKKITKVIHGLHQKSQNSNFEKVYYENTPIGFVNATTSTARPVDKKEDGLKSRALITGDVMKAIADDRVRVIGVYGPGGVGKSKLLEDVERRVKEENLFDVVAMANVSRNPNLKRIQKEITDVLGLHLMNEKTVRGRAYRLREALESDPKKNVLIILDDLWEKLELKEIGIPCGDDNKARGCKLLLTSRNRDVLRIAMGFEQEFRLDELKHEEARRLFERTMGNRVNDPKFETWVDGVVKNCGGLPLLIVPLAKGLKHKDLAAWRNASTNRDLSDVKSLVELSYNDLKDERIRSLFLVCALTSGRISMRDSLVYCMGLGLFKKFNNTIQKARDRLIEDLHTLQDSSLLLESDDMERFKMHDIFVDVASSMHDEFMDMKWNALVGRKDYGFKEWSEDELRKCTTISFPYVGIDELPEKLDCPNLRMLLLFEDNPSLKIHDLFFKSMKKLQVLDLTGLSLTSLPSSIESLENLKSLSLDFCHLDDVTVLGKLKGLQFLSFLDSTIARLPPEIGGLTELRFLDLRGCSRLKVIERGVLGSLVNLEELYMEDSFDQWEAEDEPSQSNASLAELKSMKKLSTLYIAIPHSANLSRDLPFGKLNKYKIQIGDVWDWSGEYKESKTLKLKLDSGNLLEKWVQRCLRITQDLHLDGLQGGIDTIHDLCIEGFQELKHLHVQNSPSVQYIVHSMENVQCTAFTKLESLFLENLNKLEKICRGCLSSESLSKLKIVKVDNCGEIKHLFTFPMTRIFLQLEEIEISRCHLMQLIVADAEADEDKIEINDDPTVNSCNLRRLTLRNLTKMASFHETVDHSVVFFDAHQVSLPWLESLTLSELPKLKEIWNSQFLSDVSNLKFLKVEDCMFLLSIIPSSLLMKLQNLEAITIERCQLIREVFDLEGLTINGDVEILSRLTKLTLSDLPSLGHIWNKNPRRALCFRNLRALKVQNCENLRFLFSSSMAKALGQMKEIEVVSCKLIKEIMEQEEESEKATTMDTLVFPLLTSLSLEALPSLRTFSNGKFYIHCPSLTRLRVSGCPKMMTFSSFEGKQQSMTTDTSLQQAFGCINSGLSLPVFFNQNVHFPSLEELTLLSLCGLRRIWHNEIPEESFCKLASISVKDCENLSHIFPSTLIERLQSLKMIEVVECTSLEALMEHVYVNTKKRPKCLTFLDLKEVKLWHLPRLNAIVTSSTKAKFSLPSLIDVSLRCCDELRYLFTKDTARTLDKLEMLDISRCVNMQQIIAVEEGEEQKLKAVKFSHLCTLKLCSLKSLTSFSSGSGAYEFPSLQNLSIMECSELKAFILRPLAASKEMNERTAGFDKGPYCLFDKKVILPNLEELRLTGIESRELWESESTCFHSLTSIRVEDCPCLRNLFTMSMAKSLGHLQSLSLGGCGEMEYIVGREEEKSEEAANKIIIPQLVTLYIHNMPKLRSFCHEKHISEWPLLKQLSIEDCKAVKVILGDTCYREQSLLPVEKIVFPSMESMCISHMNNVEKIWTDEFASNAFSKLKILMVEYCEKLSSIFSSDTILTRFQNLEELTMTDCGSLEVVFHIQELNMSGAHSTSTSQLRELYLERLPKLKHVWSGLPSSVAKSITKLERLVVQSCGVEDIIASEDEGVRMSASDFFFPRLTTLTLDELPELRSFYKNSYTPTWPHLKELLVRHCGKMKSFSFASEIQSCNGSTTNENQPSLSLEKVFPHLKRLTLTREDVAMMQHDIFGDLKELTLAYYRDENVSFPSNFFLQRFPNLEYLTVEHSSFEEIFSEDAFAHEGVTPCGGIIEREKPLKAFGNLKRLWLHDLWNLRRIWKDGSLMAEILKQIEDLWVWRCPGLSILFPSLTSVQSLTYLQVQNCEGLVHMGTCSAMTSLVHLTRLILRECGTLEDVVTDDGNEAEEISFPKLQRLTLDGLPSLKSFSPTNSAFRFPSLVCTIVTQCPNMIIFCKGALRTPKLHKVLLSYQYDEGHWEDDLNTTIRTVTAREDPYKIQ
ncbi:uncharacterized protein LOC104431149 isoform X3 [Eucalyptus grandis]|uniref:uncharacterized protein LOC104431149 isoform X3 n=1 Tax=Eucalyptus grandis TaxID=71139 RepID=UPI00192E8A35|nr:uncharacterized protein LOC104431149 isoform X3 [Eucalyptus grandis]